MNIEEGSSQRRSKINRMNKPRVDLLVETTSVYSALNDAIRSIKSLNQQSKTKLLDLIKNDDDHDNDTVNIQEKNIIYKVKLEKKGLLIKQARVTIWKI